MVRNEIISLSIFISALLLGMFSGSLELANSETGFCYDQIGDGHYCYDEKAKCEIAIKVDNMAESFCYDES